MKSHIISLTLIGFLVTGCIGDREPFASVGQTPSTELLTTPTPYVSGTDLSSGLITQSEVLGNGYVYQALPSRDGSFIAVDHSEGVTVFQQDPFEERWTIPFASEQSIGMIWSNDNSALYIAHGNERGNLSIFTIDPMVGTSRELFELEPAATQAFFSPNGNLVADIVGTAIVVHSIDNGATVNRLNFAESSSVLTASWSPDGNLLAAASAIDGVRVWNIRTGEIVLQVAERIFLTSELVFSPDNQSLLIASQSDLVHVKARAYGVWDLRADKIRWLITDNPAQTPLHHFLWTNEGLYGWDDERRGLDRLIRFDVQTGQYIWEREGNSSGGLLAMGETVLVLDGEALTTVSAETGDVVATNSVISGYSLQALIGDRFLLKSTDGIALYQKDGTLAGQSHGFLELLHGVFSPRGDQIAIASRTRTYIWDSETGNLLYDIPITGLLSWAPDEKQLAILTENGRVTFVDTVTGSKVAQYSADLVTPSGLAWISSNRLLIGGSLSETPIFFNDKQLEPYIDRKTTLFVMDTGTGRRLETLPVNGEPHSIVLSPSGSEVAYATGRYNPITWQGQNGPSYVDVTVVMRDVSDLSKEKIVSLENDWINALVWEPSGNLLLGLTENGSFMWDSQDAKEVSSLGIQFVDAAMWLANRIILFNDGALIVIDPYTTKQTSYSLPDIQGQAVAFDPQGRHFLTWDNRKFILTLITLPNELVQ